MAYFSSLWARYSPILGWLSAQKPSRKVTVWLSQELCGRRSGSRRHGRGARRGDSRRGQIRGPPARRHRSLRDKRGNFNLPPWRRHLFHPFVLVGIQRWLTLFRFRPGVRLPVRLLRQEARAGYLQNKCQRWGHCPRSSTRRNRYASRHTPGDNGPMARPGSAH